MTPGSDPVLPPLLTPVAVSAAVDPFEKAVSMASLGCDAGTVVHGVFVDRLRASVIFGPEQVLEDAMAMWCACGVGFSNALGALAPPEVAVHLEWSGGIRVNGASCGNLRASASTRDPSLEPDWLVIGIEIPFVLVAESPGITPDQTALYLEGCGDVDPTMLLESWARHTLSWVNRWLEDGNAPLHSEWRSMAHDMGETVSLTYGGEEISGVFVGIDERFGMLVRTTGDTRLLPLSGLLE